MEETCRILDIGIRLRLQDVRYSTLLFYVDPKLIGKPIFCRQDSLGWA